MSAAPADERSFPERDHLTHSARLQWNLRATSPTMRAAIDHLVDDLEAGEARSRQRRPADRKSLWEAMEAMVLGLVDAAQGPKPWRAYSRQKADYGFFVDHAGVTWTAVITVADFLAAQGLAETRMGSFVRSQVPGDVAEKTGKGTGYQSRLKATTALVERLRAMEGAVASAPVFHPVRLKGPKDAAGRKPRRRPEDWPASDEGVFGAEGLEGAAARVLSSNALRASCVITIDSEQQAVEEAEIDADQAEQDERTESTDLHAVHLYRVFSNDSWRQGGRFYGGFWQGLSKHDRSRLLIDGEETVELDFQACHVRMCYHLSGLPLPIDRDPYVIPDIAPDLRSALKSLTLRLLGAGPTSRVHRPEALKSWARKDYDGLVRRVTDEHPTLSSWFRGGHWATLQNLDSQIADAVMVDLTAQDVPCLPVHDSFIVPLSAEKKLALAMTDAWRSVMIAESGIDGLPVVTGWTSEKVRDSYQLDLPPLPPSVLGRGDWVDND